MMHPPPHAREVQTYRPKTMTRGALPTLSGQSRILVADGFAYVSVGQYWAVIDEADLPRVSGCTWSANESPNGRVYAENRRFDENKKSVSRRLHRVITDCPADKYVDHIDCNPLNNLRSNLRVCSPQQNTLNTRIRSNNTSGFKGVWFRKERKKFSAQIKVGHDLIRLGCYSTAEEAHQKYVEAARRYFGEFARAS